MNRLIQHLVVITLLLATSATFAKDESDRALQLAKKWQGNNGTTIISPNGRILFVYGESQPTLVCAVFSLCDIGLEQGEVVNTVNLGDTVRWNVNPARVGEGDSLEEHLIVKPQSAGLRTSLFIATNRRSYMIELRSHETDSMGKVGFLYGARSGSTMPNAGTGGTVNAVYGNSDIELLPAPPKPATQPQIITVDPTPVGEEVIAENLNFAYQVSGARVAWRPIRVYDDGRRTFIDFDKDRIASNELPVFLVNDTNKLGGMVNYRYVNGRIIVDGLFDRGTLILGVGRGRKSQKITIRRSNKTHSTNPSES